MCESPVGHNTTTIVSLEPVKKEPVTKEPVTKEPVKKEPVTKEPVKKEPVTKEPVKKEPNPDSTWVRPIIVSMSTLMVPGGMNPLNKYGLSQD